MIYSNSEDDEETMESEFIVDTNRFDVHKSKLEFYTKPEVKKFLK